MTNYERKSIRRLLVVALAAVTFVPIATPLATTQEAPPNFIVHESPRSLPEVAFRDGDEGTVSLADFRGKVVLLNIWATWCSPCRREMPTLDRLQVQLGGPAFEVVALSIDRKGASAVRSFYSEVGIRNLAVYIDSRGKSARALGMIGLPTTLLIDRDGREVGRLIGPAEWDTPEMVAFLRSRLPEKSAALMHDAPIESAVPATPWMNHHRSAWGDVLQPSAMEKHVIPDLAVTGPTPSPEVIKGSKS